MNTLPCSASAHLIPLTSATVAPGQRASGRIKATAAEQRQLWKEAGEALLVGRKENSSDKLFGTWCAAHGFDMKQQDRSGAMWLAESWNLLTEAPCEASHPNWLRRWFRAQHRITD